MGLTVVYIVACTGILLSVTAAILYLIGGDAYGAVGAVSTIISIVLGVVSIGYSYFSGKKTDETLGNIKSQNEKLVAKINYELSRDNYDQNNIDAIRRTLDTTNRCENIPDPAGETEETVARV